ncbi:hypothetical protein GTR02_20260 [Kineococcus sp. R8]|uniref:hypothetical protein n=1 Tax=Kineococcus siccus TaxID=2696567 RepID=UPI00196B1534|nr:hypothetical protein [Kineococcus siccus]NAZ84144.1 hypothetical protein [Kineococcus siccus]
MHPGLAVSRDGPRGLAEKRMIIRCCLSWLTCQAPAQDSMSVLLGLTAAYRRSRENAGRYLPSTVRRFDRCTGTMVTTKTWWALSLAAVAFTAAGAWWGRVAGGYGGFLSLLETWVPDVLGAVMHPAVV